jgi:beta-lactamase class A
VSLRGAPARRSRRLEPARVGGRAGSFIALSLVALALLAGCGGTSKPSSSTTQSTGRTSAASTLEPVTATPASRQLEWVITQLDRSAAPSDALLAEHFSSAFLAAVPPKQLVAALTALAGQGMAVTGAFAGQSPHQLVAELTGRAGATFKVSITVSPTAPYLIDGLLFTPLASAIATWSGVDAALERLASHASLYAGIAGGGEIHALNATRPGAIGSAFKLYVLGALAQAIRRHTVDWTTPLAIHERWKSLPGGDMRLEPAGATFTMRHYAQQMISVSDNTAADHLIHRLGRAAVEAQLVALGNHSVGRNEPFLTTREMFALKLAAPASLRDAFAAGDTAVRERLLPSVDVLGPTLAEASGWTTPRLIDSIEWFASPVDLAHAIGALEALSHEPGLSPVRQILAINPGLQLDPARWSYVGYKGGSEPGVISTTWYLERSDGRAFVLSIVLNDPNGDISTLGEVSVAQAAINLLAHA